MDDKTAFRDVLSGEKKERKEKEHEIKKSYNEMKQEQGTGKGCSWLKKRRETKIRKEAWRSGRERRDGGS